MRVTVDVVVGVVGVAIVATATTRSATKIPNTNQASSGTGDQQVGVGVAKEGQGGRRVGEELLLEAAVEATIVVVEVVVAVVRVAADGDGGRGGGDDALGRATRVDSNIPQVDAAVAAGADDARVAAEGRVGERGDAVAVGRRVGVDALCCLDDDGRDAEAAGDGAADGDGGGPDAHGHGASRLGDAEDLADVAVVRLRRHGEVVS